MQKALPISTTDQIIRRAGVEAKCLQGLCAYGSRFSCLSLSSARQDWFDWSQYHHSDYKRQTKPGHMARSVAL